MLRLLFASLPIVLPLSIFPLVLDANLLPGFVVLAIYSIVLWLAIARQNQRGEATLLPSYWALGLAGLLFVLWTGISIGYSIASADAVFGLVKYTAIGTLTVGLAILIKRDNALVDALLKGVIISAIITAVFGMMQLAPIIELIVETPDLTYQVNGLMGHKNLYSSWLMLLLPLVAWAVFRLRNAWRIVAVAAIILLSVIILLVQSRAAWVALVLSGMVIVGLLLVGTFGSKTIRLHLFKPYRVMWGVALTLPLLLVIAMFVAKPTLLENVRHRIHYSINYMGPKNQDNETIRERLYLWRHTWQMIKEKPLVGHGGGSWRILFPKYGLQENRSQQGYIHFQRPHNDWLWVWAEYGLVGLVPWAALWLMVIGILIRQFWKFTSPASAIQALLLLFGVMAFLINGIFDFPMERSTHLGIMAIYVALAAALGATTKTYVLNKWLPRGMVAIAIACTVVLLIRLRSDAMVVQSYKHHAMENYPQAIAMAQHAKNFVYHTDGVSAPMEYYEGNGWLALNNNQAALAAFQAAYKHHPYHLMVLNNLGSTWQFLGETDSAKHYYFKALRISPRFEEPLLNMGALYFNQRITDSAYYYLNAVYPDSKNPRYRPSINALLMVEVRLLKQTVAPESAEWVLLDYWEQNPEELFKHYFKAWVVQNITWQPLTREQLHQLLLAP